MQESQKEAIKWIAIIGVGGYVLYTIGKKLGLITPSIDLPNATTNTPTAKDYTHTNGFDSATIAKNIYDSFSITHGDPFDKVFAIIKANVKSQGDWQSLDNSFQTLYGEELIKYFGDLNSGYLPVAFWETLSSTEINQIVTYINQLPL